MNFSPSQLFQKSVHYIHGPSTSDFLVPECSETSMWKGTKPRSQVEIGQIMGTDAGAAIPASKIL